MPINPKLGRAMRIIGNPHRWTEMGWRVWFRLCQSELILRTLERAYADANSTEAALVRHQAEVAWGLAKGNLAQARGYARIAYQLQPRLAKQGQLLGTAKIGFEDLKIYSRSADANSSRVYLAGFDESLTLFEVYRNVIQRGTTAIDVGANIGMHTQVLSRCVGENGRVYSYEPSTALCARIKENLELNRISNVTLRNAGAGARDCVMHFQPRIDEFNIGIGRFHKNGSTEVEVVRLDSDLSAIERISFIKIDVEGMELDVIRGATALLGKHRPTLVMECNPDWTLEDLRQSMPYPITISSIPETLLDRSWNLDKVHRFRESQNIVVKPALQGKTA